MDDQLFHNIEKRGLIFFLTDIRQVSICVKSNVGSLLFSLGLSVCQKSMALVTITLQNVESIVMTRGNACMPQCGYISIRLLRFILVQRTKVTHIRDLSLRGEGEGLDVRTNEYQEIQAKYNE